MEVICCDVGIEERGEFVGWGAEEEEVNFKMLWWD